MASSMTVPVDQFHGTLKQYHAVMHRDVSTDKGHIYYSRPIQKWILAQRKGDKVRLTFHDECPCSQL
jgi:hypothetical protein